MSRGKRSEPSNGRTEEEREHDRAERARRRAERMGGQAPATQQPDGEGSGAPAISPQETLPADASLLPDAPGPAEATTALPAEEQHHEWVPPGEPASAEPPVAEHAPAVPEANAEPAPSEPEPGDGGSAQPDGGPAQHGERLEAPDVPSEPQDVRVEPVDVPPEPAGESGRSRSAPRVRGSVLAADAALSSRRGSRARGSTAGPRRPGRRSPIARTIALVALVAVVAVVAAVVLLAKSLAGSGKSKTVPLVPVAKVVIPEGSTRLQIAQIASHDGLTGSYRGASKHSPLLSPTHYGAPSSTHDLEGFLFPATYDVFRGAPVSKLVQEQLVAFRENFGSSETARARALHVTPYGLLTVASMVEREAKVPGDRAKIAAVIYNRLKREMPLGVDATIYYAIELEKGIATYTSELTEAQLHLNSPYNTRTHTGLPPTPIANPGLASIEAAANPAHVSYIYYVLAADGCGEHVFSSTLAQFEVDAAAYQAAVRKNGGAPPSCKK